jgi:hypothetical protein
VFFKPDVVVVVKIVDADDLVAGGKELAGCLCPDESGASCH